MGKTPMETHSLEPLNVPTVQPESSIMPGKAALTEKSSMPCSIPKP
jgi:hypothetical protein